MSLHLHGLTRLRIRRLFTDAAAPKTRKQVFKALDRCPACADYYRRHQAAESVLCGVDVPYTAFSIERVGAAVIGAANPSQVSKRSALLRWSALPAGVASAVLALLLLPSLGGPAPDRAPLIPNATLSPITLVARGGAPRSALSDVGFRLFRVVEGGRSVEEGGDLSINDIITFTYTQVNTPGGNLALFGIQDTGEIRWYYPGYDSDTSVAIAGDKVDEPLRDGIDLSVNHTPGRLRITALFTDAPLTKAEIEAAASRIGTNTDAEEPPPIVLSKYPEPLIQYSVIVEIEGTK